VCNMMLSIFNHNIIRSIIFDKDWRNEIVAKYAYQERKYCIQTEATLCKAQLSKAIKTGNTEALLALQ
jgi:hypothetical protein